MEPDRRSSAIRVNLLFILSCCIGTAQAADPVAQPSRPAAAKKTPKRLSVTPHQADHSGEPRRGKASFYGKEFFGRTMADGTPMNPNANIAASRTLPLGTTARVTNLENGRSAVVEIRDRGPYIDGRIVDLAPKVATQLGFRNAGVASVEVTPIEVPLPDGSIKLGAAAPAATAIVQAAAD